MDKQRVEATLQQFERRRSSLLPALRAVQQELGYLPAWAMALVSRRLRVPASEVHGVACSYSELRLELTAPHRVRVCLSLSCWLAGGGRLYNAVEGKLRAQGDGQIALERMDCAFLCAVAPVVECDGTYVGRADEAAVAAAVEGLVGQG
ncbi:MAG: NAD(P)H-dependent oxidoreductase subunit E [Dehalococcoidia bacterium]